MKTQNLDIVIPLKEENDNEELRYVLRSIAQNLPHRKVFLAGFTPDWVQNVESIQVAIPDGLKYGKSMANTKAACLDSRVSDDFILFNDDFFVMKPVEMIEPVHRGLVKKFHTLYAQLDTRYHNYRDGIKRVRDILEALGFDDKKVVSYELHTPMIFNKAKRLEVYALHDRFPAGDLALHTNTIYGNLFGVGGEYTEDVKYHGVDDEPDMEASFISSGDESFARGLIGQYVRSKFTEKCKYEK